MANVIVVSGEFFEYRIFNAINLRYRITLSFVVAKVFQHRKVDLMGFSAGLALASAALAPAAAFAEKSDNRPAAVTCIPIGDL
jgi:hypothetical protein